MKILLTYSTTDGHTIRICEHIKSIVESQGHELDILPMAETTATVMSHYDRVIIGASIRYGKHQPAVYEFIDKHQTLLEAKDGGFFSVCLVARKPNKNTPETNPYFIKFLKRINWQPKFKAVFAGKINYPIYKWNDRLMIRFIMLITSGPTDPSTVKVFTDWEKVELFANAICQ